MNLLKILTLEPSADYELLDSGEGEKLERYGQFVLSRPDPQALWSKKLPFEEWKKADALFYRSGTTAGWKVKKELPKEWTIKLAGLTFVIKPSSFKHTGLFPEQASNWKWIMEQVEKRDQENNGERVRVLNLFGYTGGATLAAAKAGAEVTHVDGSKIVVTWAKKNAEVSKLNKEPIRWLIDDARGFVEREIRRGKVYDAIVMDPPAFGHGAKDEIWKIEEDFLKLLEASRKILSDKPLFVIINGYSAGYSAIGYHNALVDMMKGLAGETEMGELTIEEGGENKRLLPSGIFVRWLAK
jgi:23S rRNA (cytosine1962-C5)-methyltransferase